MLKGLHRQGHSATFFERDVEYYAAHRDLSAPDFCELVLYEDWASIQPRARAAVRSSDVAMVTSYCADGFAACRLVLDTPGPRHVFYDLDTPVTLAALEKDGLAIGGGAHYLRPELIPEFDLYLSFTGGPILATLEHRWGARCTAPLYGCVDPEVHTPVSAPPEALRCSLGYLGTYAADRQPMLQRLLIEPAHRRRAQRFLVVGSLYPASVEWPANVMTHPHLDPSEHPAFYAASRLTLSVTRQPMRDWGYTPSGRLFEAAACGTPVVSDSWEGLEKFFEPGKEILVASSTSDVINAVTFDPEKLRRVGRAARKRVLNAHTAQHRSREFVQLLEAAA